MRAITILAILLLVITGCGGNRQVNESDDFITVDVTANYPKKELILQDFMDVEYIALETNDDFLTQGDVLAIGKEFLLVRNLNSDGDIFAFDRNGAGLRKFNRLGRGPKEYLAVSNLMLDEDNGEIFVIDSFDWILVYDLYGNFRRSFNPKERTRFEHTYNYSNDKFICLGATPFDKRLVNTSSFLIVSKHDGSIYKEIQIPSIESAPMGLQIHTDDGLWRIIVMTAFFHSLIPYHNDWIVTEPSSDTVFRYLQDHSMHPLIVRTPHRTKMSRKAFLFPGIITDRYYFMIVLKEDTSGAEPPWPKMTNDPVMTTTNLVYDKQERIIFEPIVYNGDFLNQKRVSMFQKTADNSEIAFWLKIEAEELVEAYQKGELKGQLKEVAAMLEVDSNPVIMLVKYKI